MAARALRGEINVAKAVIEAEAELAEDPQAPPETVVDGDWLYRWRDSASAVSSDELQSMWGRVLAGEIKSPGAFSLRTLDFLRCLSREEALQIANLSRFVVAGCIFRNGKKLLEDEGVTYGVLMEMQQLGILAGVEALGLSMTLQSVDSTRFVRPLTSHNRALLCTHEDPSRVLKLPVYQITALGRQVLQLGSFEPHDKYLREVGRHIREHDFSVVIGDWIDVDDSSGRFLNPNEL